MSNSIFNITKNGATYSVPVSQESRSTGKSVNQNFVPLMNHGLNYGTFEAKITQNARNYLGSVKGK